jgi:hypothetical protein
MAFPALLILLIHQGLHQWGVDNGDFSRFMNAINTEVSLVDRRGAIHEGILTESTGDTVTMTIGSDTKIFPRPDVVSAERLRDRRSDGAAKGAIVGFIVGLFARQVADSPEMRQAHWAGWTGIFAGVGWMLDAGQDHRETIYESYEVLMTPPPAVKVKLRF